MADIKVKLGVDGESSFKTSITNSTAAVKEMKSQLDLAASAYQLSGDKAQYLKDKSAALKGEIEAQKSVVTALQAALDNAKAKYGENSAKVAVWQTKLNQAKTSLNNMQSELNQTEAELGELGTSMDDATTDAGELAEALGEVNQKGGLETLRAGLESISGLIARVAAEAVKMGKALWGGTKEASDWADSLTTQSQQYGIDRQTLQQWAYASQQIDTSVDTILAARQKMIKNMAYPSKDVAAVWEALGIETYDGQGGLRDANDVFWEAIEALGQIENETDRDAAAMALFGKKAAELNPIIQAGREAWEAYMREAGETGAVLGEEDLDNLQTFNDEWQKLNLQMQSLKYKFYAGIAPGMTIVAEALQEAGKQLDAFLQTAEGKAAVEQLGKTIGAFVQTLVDKLPQLLPLLTRLAEALTSLLSFVADNAEAIMGVLGGLFVGGKASQFASWFGNLPLFKGLFGGGGGGTAAAAGGAGAGAGTATNLTALGNALSSLAPLGVFLAGTLPSILVQAADNQATAAKLAEMSAEAEAAAASAGKAGVEAKAAADAAIEGLGLAGKSVYGQDRYSDPAKVSEAMDKVAGMGDLSFLSGQSQLMMEQYKQGLLSAQETNALLWQVAQEAIQYLKSPNGGGEGTDLGDTIDQVIELKEALAEDPSGNESGLYETIRQLSEDKDVLAALSEETRQLLAEWMNPESGFGNGGPTLFSDSKELLDKMLGDLEAATAEAEAAGAQIGESAENGAAGADLSGGGNNAGSTFVNALSSWISSAFEAGAALGSAAAEGLSGSLEIHSPSRVMREMGGFVAEGFAEGITDGIGLVEDAVYSMSDATSGTVMKHQNGRPGGDMAAMIANALSGVVVQIDGQDAGRLLAPTVSTIIGDEADAWRYETE